MHDVIVVGAGTAGMTAALNVLRNGKSVLVLEKENIGGQIALSPRVENFPTIKAISGTEFADRLFDQISFHGADFEMDDVLKIEKRDGVFVLTGEFGTYEGKSVIAACGAKPRKIGLPFEDELIGHGVSYCALCDGAFYEGEDVALVGDANTALQYALFLSGICRTVRVCTLFDRFFADACHVKNLLTKDNVEIRHNLSLKKFLHENGELTGLVFENTEDGSVFETAVKAVFIAIGQVPDNSVFAGLADVDRNGYIVADDSCRTRTEGLFAAGDCRVKEIRQLSTAAADGATAAHSASLYLS